MFMWFVNWSSVINMTDDFLSQPFANKAQNLPSSLNQSWSHTFVNVNKNTWLLLHARRDAGQRAQKLVQLLRRVLSLGRWRCLLGSDGFGVGFLGVAPNAWIFTLLNCVTLAGLQWRGDADGIFGERRGEHSKCRVADELILKQGSVHRETGLLILSPTL